jgi:hypothetical protein
MSQHNSMRRALLLAAVGVAVTTFGACSSDTTSGKVGTGGAGGVPGATGGVGGKSSTDASTDASADAGSTDCFAHPTTHFEIINACTTAEAVDKSPNLPLLLADGGLPPLP